MPLPYAPPPQDSKVYRDLKNLKISGVTADQIDTLKEALYAQGTDGSEDEMRRLNLLGQASNQQSTSGAIPATVQVTKTVASVSGSKYAAFTPPSGTVWQIGPASFQLSGATGSVTCECWLYGPWPEYTGGDGTSVRVLVSNASSSSSSYQTMNEGSPYFPLYIDENSSIKFEATGTFTTVQFYMHAVRVR